MNYKESLWIGFTARLSTRTASLLLAIAIVIAYMNSLSIGFYFDDTYQIEQNTAIRSVGNVLSMFTNPVGSYPTNLHGGVRPLLMASYALNYAVSGLSPWSWHLLGLVLHWLTAILVFVIVRDYI